MLKQAYDAGAKAALAAYGVGLDKTALAQAAGSPQVPRRPHSTPTVFKPSAPVQGPGFFEGIQQHGQNLVSGLQGWLGGPRIDPNFKGKQTDLRKDLIAGREAARGQVWESLKGLAPAAGLAGLGAYTLLRDSPEEAARKRGWGFR